MTTFRVTKQSRVALLWILAVQCRSVKLTETKISNDLTLKALFLE